MRLCCIVLVSYCYYFFHLTAETFVYSMMMCQCVIIDHENEIEPMVMMYVIGFMYRISISFKLRSTIFFTVDRIRTKYLHEPHVCLVVFSFSFLELNYN